ncbi:helix-turn-helix transcriptional regulator [Alteromonas pelagimontana]|uniref:Helix-turn-helix transcriptional regulator n=1 Tax=Alteromonas pelagimontana TaxID=1858656 RepID=A0A6M4MGW8_9ALTE|nr:helix-turn-helix transcriptional regulator [Alteromonas pelagimontana]QJR82148.1 helix-turn-helix transcriptional regulator [Alteromonas pelagimontana]
MKTIFDADYRKVIGWLIAERKFKKMSQPELAEKLGFPSNSYVSKIETFERKLDILEYVRLCEALELDAKEGLEMLKKRSKQF